MCCQEATVAPAFSMRSFSPCAKCGRLCSNANFLQLEISWSTMINKPLPATSRAFVLGLWSRVMDFATHLSPWLRDQASHLDGKQYLLIFIAAFSEMQNSVSQPVSAQLVASRYPKHSGITTSEFSGFATFLDRYSCSTVCLQSSLTSDIKWQKPKSTIKPQEKHVKK